MLWKVPGWTNQFVAVTTERKFKEYVQRLVKELNLTAPSLAYLAETDTPLSQVLAMMGTPVKAIPGARENPGGRYLLGLSDDAILGLLREAVPAQAEVLDRYPEYATRLTGEIKQLVLGEGTGSV